MGSTFVESTFKEFELFFKYLHTSFAELCYNEILLSILLHLILDDYGILCDSFLNESDSVLI